jgi:Catechol dioxygenase N terminus
VTVVRNVSEPTAEVFPELTQDVIHRMRNAESGRLREVMAIVVRHLHAIVRETNLTQGEWSKAIDFLTRSDSRQEFILLSDILGVSMLVDAVDNVEGPGISDSTVLGPFYAGHQRELAQGDSILLREEAASDG